jgi:hypothetical protein
LLTFLSQNFEAKRKPIMPVEVGLNTDDLNGYSKRFETKKHSIALHFLSEASDQELIS